MKGIYCLVYIVKQIVNIICILLAFIQIYKKGTDSALINAWFEFIESSEGQQIIKDVGLIGTANKNG